MKTSTTARLYTFTISHYCEKARWALDYLDIDYVEVPLLAGAHMQTAKKLGLAQTSTPFLQVGDKVIHGSSAIIDWAEGESDKSLAVKTNHQVEVEAFESRLDQHIGVHVRRMFYSDALLAQDKKVKRIFQYGQPFLQRIKFHFMWPTVRQRMIKLMDLGEQQFESSKGIVGRELDWLDSMLDDGRSFLVGSRFSRADITAASLLARATKVQGHPGPSALFDYPPKVRQVVDEWSSRPSLKWVQSIYAQYRHPTK